jgi:RNA polymerase sigma-70 factor, ECF subfamily
MWVIAWNIGWTKKAIESKTASTIEVIVPTIVWIEHQAARMKQVKHGLRIAWTAKEIASTADLTARAVESIIVWTVVVTVSTAGTSQGLIFCARFETDCGPYPMSMGTVSYDLIMGNANDLNLFLASVEKRAYAMTVVAVKNSDDALDIVQDAMFTLSKKYANKRNDEWAPLFYRILQNRIKDFHRSGKLRNRLFAWLQPKTEDAEDPLAQFPAPTQNNPDRSQVLNEATERLTDALYQLPTRQQQAFMLRAWEGMDVAECAKSMGCSQGTVKTHYSRAVHALREQLQELKDV